MSIVVEFFQIVFDCVRKFFGDGISFSNMNILTYKLALFLGIALTSIFLGWATYRSSMLWNKKVTDIALYRWPAGLSFALSLLFAISFFSLGYLHEVVIDRTEEWKGYIKDDSDWSTNTFKITYDMLKRLGEEDFKDYPPPEAGGHKIPLYYESSRRITAQSYVEEATKHFKENHPYLSLILKTDLDIPENKIYQDSATFFKENPGQTYQLIDAIRIAADELKAGFDRRIPPLIKITRIYLVIIFSVMMAVIYLVIGIIAYRDIKTFS